MPSRSFISQPSAWAYLTTGMPRRAASRTSGFVSRIAAETMTRPSLSVMCSGLWPMETWMPRRVSDSMMSLPPASQPVTVQP